MPRSRSVLIDRCRVAAEGDAYRLSPDPRRLHLSDMGRAVGTLVIAVMCAPVVAAQDALTLDKALQAVAAHNVQLAAANAAATEAGAAADEASSVRYPRISFSESWQRGTDPVFAFSSLLSARHFSEANFAPDALNHPPATSAFRATVAVDQIVFDGGQRTASARAARQQADAAQLAVAARTADLRLAASATFGRILVAQAAQRAAASALTSAREDHVRAERRRDAGLATDADVLALAVRVADLDRRSIQAAGDAAVAAAELNRLMGEPVSRAWLAVDAPGTDDPAPLPDLAALLHDADAARPEIRRASALEKAAAESGRAASRMLVPQLAVLGAVDAAGTDFAHRASAWIAGGELRWTFSGGGGELARRRGAAAGMLRARAEAEDARAAVHVDVVTAYRQLETARLRHAAMRTTVAQARESQRIVRDRFDAGLAGVNDVLRASSDLLDAESNEIAARVDTLVGAAALARATGRIQ